MQNIQVNHSEVNKGHVIGTQKTVLPLSHLFVPLIINVHVHSCTLLIKKTPLIKHLYVKTYKYGRDIFFYVPLLFSLPIK